MTQLIITTFWGDGGKGKQIDYTNIAAAKKDLKQLHKHHKDIRLYYSKEVNDNRIFYYRYSIINGKIIKENINFDN